MNEEQIKKLIQDEINAFMNTKQFNLSKLQNHIHSGSDTQKIPIASIQESIAIEGKSGGVFSPTILDTQKVNNEYTSSIPNPATVYMLPINIIYGSGVGVHSAFNGGTAKPGTMIYFENDVNSSLWIYSENGWRGVYLPETA